MNRTSWILSSILLLFAGIDFAFGDDLTGADRLLCTSVRAMECFPDGVCLADEPESWNVPRFIRVDLKEQIMSTTAASGEERSTPIETIERDRNRVFIQGAEQGRAFSSVLNEITGLASTGIALDGHVVSVFSYCTPIDGSD